MAEFEDRLRGALRARAQGVRPDPRTWQRIESRIRRRQILTWAAPATAVAAVAAVAVLVVPQLQEGGDDVELSPDEPEITEETDEQGDEESFAAEPFAEEQTESAPEPEPLPEGEEEAPSEGEDGQEDDQDDDAEMLVTAYLVRSAGDGFYVEPAEVTLGLETTGIARASMEALVVGGSGELITLAPDGTRVLGATISDGVLKVDMSEEVRDSSAAGAEAEEAFAQQLAHTAAQFDGVEAVELLVGGSGIDELWGHLDWSQPIEPDDLALSPVVIEEIEVEDGTVTVSGQATVYEATVELRLINPDGAVVADTFANAECGAPCRGEWEHAFEASAGSQGTWTVEASQPQVTDEGPAPFETSAEVTVD